MNTCQYISCILLGLVIIATVTSLTIYFTVGVPKCWASSYKEGCNNCICLLGLITCVSTKNCTELNNCHGCLLSKCEGFSWLDMCFKCTCYRGKAACFTQDRCFIAGTCDPYNQTNLTSSRCTKCFCMHNGTYICNYIVGCS